MKPFIYRLADRNLMYGDVVPKWYGLCWHDPMRCFTAFAPVPFNVIMRFGREFYLWLARGCGGTWTEHLEEAAFAAGVERGRAAERHRMLNELDEAFFKQFGQHL